MFNFKIHKLYNYVKYFQNIFVSHSKSLYFTKSQIFLNYSLIKLHSIGNNGLEIMKIPSTTNDGFK